VITSTPSAHPETVGLIAGVLSQARMTAHERNTPHEARAILHLAHSFADELATADPCFDRLQFVRQATTGRL
jgi:hypothetical protein